MTRDNENQKFIRIQVLHAPQPDRHHYQPESIETAINSLNLNEGKFLAPHENESGECLIRHETGPEIILLITSLVSLAKAIIGLVRECRKHRPETRIAVTVHEPEQLEKVLEILGQ